MADRRARDTRRGDRRPLGKGRRDRSEAAPYTWWVHEAARSDFLESSYTRAQEPDPLPGDMSLPDGLYMSSEARGLLDKPRPYARHGHGHFTHIDAR